MAHEMNDRSVESSGAEVNSRRFDSIEGLLGDNGKSTESVYVAMSSADNADDVDEIYKSGLLQLFRKDYEPASDFLEQTYEMGLKQRNYSAAIKAMIDLAWLKYNHGNPDDGRMKAWRLLDEAESMLAVHNHESGINLLRSRYLHIKGLIAYRDGDYGNALRLFKQAITFSSPDSIEFAKLQDSLGIHYERVSDFNRAVQCLERSLHIKRKLENTLEIAISCQILGYLFIRMEQFATARQYLEEALAIADEKKDHKRVANIQNEIIKLMLNSGDAAGAEYLIEQVLPQNRERKLWVPTAYTELYKAYILAGKKQYHECLKLIHNDVIPMFKRYHCHKGYGVASRLRAAAENQTGEFNQALESMGEAISVFKAQNVPDELAKTHLELGKIFASHDAKALAMESLMEAIRLSERHGLVTLASYIEDEIFKLDEDQWKDLVCRRTNHQPIFKEEPTLLDALSALSDEELDESKQPSTPEEAKKRRYSLVSLLRVGQAMAGERDLEKLLLIIKDETERALDADRCTVFLYDQDTNELWSRIASGLERTEEIRFPAHMGLAGYVVKTGDVLNIKDAYSDPRFNKDVDKKTGYKTENILCMPLRNRNMQIIGVFQVLNKRNGCFEKSDEEFLMAICANAAIAIENARLVTDQKIAFESFIKTLSSTIDARDPITAGHSERVADYSLLLGKEIRLPDTDLDALNYASLLHDIGKIGIREDILVKDGRLTEKEYRHIQKHAYYTYEILKNIHFEPHLRSVPEIAAAHHEKWDGTGYFRSMKGTAIPLSGRILAISDVLDAITSRRHYRDRMPFDRVLSVFRKGANQHFDADCIESFFNLKLYRVSKVLMREKRMGQAEESTSLIKSIDKNITLAEYEVILQKDILSKGEARLHHAFSSLYHQPMGMYDD